jgi:SnoaL-like domain
VYKSCSRREGRPVVERENPVLALDQTLSARRVEERLEKTAGERPRILLATVAEHLRAESTADVDKLLATLVEHPDYHLWSGGRDVGPKGRDGVLGYYRQLVEDRRQILEFDVDRIVVDDDTVVTEGWIRAINRGHVARNRGWEVDDEQASYLVTQRVVIFWPFDEEGRMLGEDGYATWDPQGARKLAEEELPDAYRRLFVNVA